jgi:hypothetical protein
MSQTFRKPVKLPPGVAITGGPESCPACGSQEIMWGCNPSQTKGKAEIHPLVWSEQGMADSWICESCQAGWVERREVAPLTWVRPYWITA